MFLGKGKEKKEVSRSNPLVAAVCVMNNAFEDLDYRLSSTI